MFLVDVVRFCQRKMEIYRFNKLKFNRDRPLPTPTQTIPETGHPVSHPSSHLRLRYPWYRYLSSQS